MLGYGHFQPVILDISCGTEGAKNATLQSSQMQHRGELLSISCICNLWWRASLAQLSCNLTLCVLVVSWASPWPRLVPCVLANRFVCVSSNRSVCKFKAHGSVLKLHTCVSAEAAAATGAAKITCSKSSGSRIKQWQHQEQPTAPTTAVAAVAWPSAVARSNDPACLSKRATRPFFFLAQTTKLAHIHPREPTTLDLRTRLERENDVSHTESSVLNAATLRLSVLMTVPAGKEITKEGCKKTKEHDDSGGEWRENDETQWRDYVVGEFREYCETRWR